MSKSINPGPVPARWLNCPRKSNDVIIGKFIALKTPLNSNYDSQVPPACRFTPKMFFDSCRSKKIKVGLWIDLTNTKRFYDQKEIENEGCSYVKLQCRGHGETPDQDQTNTFTKLVNQFISKNPLECIAVHCTHGFNRTGFLIVSYLVKNMDCGLDVAMETFSRARPPGIYKDDYIEELYRRYDEVEEATPAPPLPDWCFENNDGNHEIPEEPDDVNGFNSEAASTSQNSGEPPRKKARHAKVGVFMEGVPGVKPFTEQPKACQLQRAVQRMCDWKTKNGFPGCQPVSMDMNNLKFLSMKQYKVSWKADGTRYMMLIDGEDEVYFFDRDHNVFKVSGLRFPYRKDLHRHLKQTLLDGEMVIDKVNGENIPRYLAYDIVKFESLDVGKTPFTLRLYCLENEIIKPRYAAMEAGIINKASEPFSVRKKDFWDVTQAAGLLGEKFAKTLSHEPDGLIFQPARDLYVAGRCDEVLKWKPIELNSVDFRLRIVKERGTGIIGGKVCHLFVGQCDRPFSQMKYNKTLKDLDGKIVECKFENGQWKFMRERADKSFPNSYDTAKAVCGSIAHPITKEVLLKFIETHRYIDDKELMPPPAKTIRR